MIAAGSRSCPRGLSTHLRDSVKHHLSGECLVSSFFERVEKTGVPLDTLDIRPSTEYAMSPSCNLTP